MTYRGHTMAIFRDRFLKRLFIVAIATIAIANFGIREMAGLTRHMQQGVHVPPHISASRTQHILYGDAHGGGGHLHGVGKPCKSEFPADWSAEKIIATVTQDAANDNLNWRHEKNGYEVADTTDGGVTIRIVVNGDHSEIITAYPTSTPRNPCPAANDNGD